MGNRLALKARRIAVRGDATVMTDWPAVPPLPPPFEAFETTLPSWWYGPFPARIPGVHAVP